MTKDEVVALARQSGVEFVSGQDKDEPSVRFHGAATKVLSMNLHCRGQADHLRADFVFTGRESREGNVEDANAFMRQYGGERGRRCDTGFAVFVRLEPRIGEASCLQRAIQAYWACSARFA